ncbi:rifin PIR protein,putative [Plasmodium sp. DRC-Itaito]|nr:rifin PIR protein,putative [Plasmodium sp. DRC-Itaito]
MKVHYINILLFAHALNILVNTHKNKSITHHTQTNRSLCECDLYAPANYDNDPQMKEVMQQFHDRTSQRFHEYDERMKTTRQKCKEQCDKQIQKIILKDKLEKELMDKFATLHTDIQSDAIPTCICEKSIADKVEKGCLRCAQNLGGIVVPSTGILGGIGIHVLNGWYTKAIADAIVAAEKSGMAAATQEGMRAVLSKIEGLRVTFSGANEGYVNLKSIVTKLTYKDGDALVEAAKKVIGDACWNESGKGYTSFYNSTIYMDDSPLNIKNFGEIGSAKFEETLPLQKAAFETRYTAAVDATTTSCQTAIISSIIAIVVIILIMVIIYLILRRRRKKKMKKKLQYIKLLEE